MAVARRLPPGEETGDQDVGRVRVNGAHADGVALKAGTVAGDRPAEAVRSGGPLTPFSDSA